MEFFKFSYWIKKSIIFTAPPEKLHQTVLFCLNFSHHGKSLVNPKKKWWFRITSRPPPFWQGCETQFPVCSLKAQRQIVDITIFQLQVKGFPGRALRQSHAEEWITGGVGSERREQPCAQGAQAALWRVRGSCSLSLGLSSSRSQLRTKEQTVFSSLCSGYGYWLFNLHEELQAMYKLVLLIDLCFRNGGDKTWTPGLRTASYNCGETGKEKEKRNDSICAVSFIWSIWSVTNSYQ